MIKYKVLFKLLYTYREYHWSSLIMYAIKSEEKSFWICTKIYDILDMIFNASQAHWTVLTLFKTSLRYYYLNRTNVDILNSTGSCWESCLHTSYMSFEEAWVKLSFFTCSTQQMILCQRQCHWNNSFGFKNGWHLHICFSDTSSIYGNIKLIQCSFNYSVCCKKHLDILNGQTKSTF